MKTYIAFTIGPIYNTLKVSHKTGHMWGASYLFSYMMKKIIEQINEKFKDHYTFIMPYTGEDTESIKEDRDADQEDIYKNLLTVPLGIGLFHDRCIFRLEDSSDINIKEAVTKVKNAVLNHIIDMVKVESKKSPDTNPPEDSQIENFFQNYFTIYAIQKELNENENPILALSPYLDMTELQVNYVEKEPYEKGVPNPLTWFLKNPNIRKSFLFYDAFPGDEQGIEKGGIQKKRIESILEIAVNGLKIKRKTLIDFINNDRAENEKIGEYDEIEDDTFIEKIKAFMKQEDRESELKKYHKYIAIIQADGDNMGKVVNRLKEDKNYHNFSKKLYRFIFFAREKINAYGGLPIFGGGDDLLFFAPVKNGEQNIFYILDELQQEFNCLFEDDREILSEKPSLSFGLSIAYYKYPLYEAHQEAVRLLFEQAKHFVQGGFKKNALSFRMLMHSGQYFGADININPAASSYGHFKKLFQAAAGDERLLYSVVHKLLRDRVLIETVSPDREKLVNYMKNTFNEDIHKSYKGFLYTTIPDFIHAVYSDYQMDKAMDVIQSSIRFVKFLNDRMD